MKAFSKLRKSLIRQWHISKWHISKWSFFLSFKPTSRANNICKQSCIQIISRKLYFWHNFVFNGNSNSYNCYNINPSGCTLLVFSLFFYFPSFSLLSKNVNKLLCYVAHVAHVAMLLTVSFPDSTNCLYYSSVLRRLLNNDNISQV